MSNLTPDQLKRIEENRARALAIRRAREKEQNAAREAQQNSSNRFPPRPSGNLISSSSSLSGSSQSSFRAPSNPQSASTNSFYHRSPPQATAISSVPFSKSKPPASIQSGNRPNQPNSKSGVQGHVSSPSNSTTSAFRPSSKGRSGFGFHEVQMALISSDRFEVSMKSFDQSVVDAIRSVQTRAYSNFLKIFLLN